MANGKQTGRDSGVDVERCKQAANDVRQQLDLGIGFCIGFVAGGDKAKFVERLAPKRAGARDEARELDGQPLTTSNA